MKSIYSSLILLLTALIWGFAFVSQSQASSFLGPLGYNGLRMLLGFLVLLPLYIKHSRKREKEEKKSLLRDGMICGILLFLASYFQQKGIEYTTAGKAGFITSLYILIVPVLSLFSGKKNSPRTWICVFTGLLGAFLLSINGKSGINRGDGLVFISAFLFSLHVIFIDRVSKNHDGVSLSTIQFLCAGLIALVLSLFLEDNTIHDIKAAAIPVLYGGIGSCGIAYTLQIIGQKYTPPTRAALILSLESVFSALGGALILSERMSTKELTGCLILFLSVIIAELPDKREENR